MKRARVSEFITEVRVTKTKRIHPNAASVKAYYPGDFDFAHNVMDGLTNSMHLYENGATEASRWQGIDRLAFYIIAAENNGLIVPGVSVEKVLAQKDEKISELEKQLATAILSHDELVGEYDSVRQKLANLEGELADCNDKFDKLANLHAGKGQIQP